MTSRRDFLEGMGWAVVPLATGLPSQLLAGEPPAASVHAVMIDAPHALALDLGSRVRARGVPAHTVSESDLTDLWSCHIGPLWKQTPVAIAGITGSSTLFCLEQLAFAHGLRVEFHAEHVLRPAGVATHRVHRCAPGITGLDDAALARDGRHWTGRVVDALLSPASQTPRRAAGPSCAGLLPEMPPDATLLASWVIAAV